MEAIYLLEQLDIIGCKEVPVLKPAMPRLLSAIFAVRDSDTVLFPPYTHGARDLIRPHVLTREEFGEMVANEDVTPYGPVQAHPEHELWLDDNGEIHYELNTLAKKNLDAIFKSRCGSADWALKAGAYTEARTHALVAFSANPKSLEPLLYRAAAEWSMIPGHAELDRVLAELALTELLAKSFIPISSFRELYIELGNSGLGRRSKYSGIAVRRPSPSPIAFAELACQ